MKMRHLFIITIGITLLVSLLCISLFPSLADFMVYNTTWNGIRRSFNEINASAVNSLPAAANPATGDVLISIPYIQYTNEDMIKIKTFVNSGGTLLLMNDFGFGNPILEYLNIDCRFSGAPLLDPLFCYQNQWFPRITDFNAAAISPDVHEIVLNHATGLINTSNTEVYAWSSSHAYLDLNGNESQDNNEPGGPIPVAAKINFGGGTIILVSDPSILINSMLVKDDNLLFINDLLNSQVNKGQVLLDTSHLVKDPMEITKSKLIDIRKFLTQPWAILSILAILFIITSTYMLKNGGSIGRKS